VLAFAGPICPDSAGCNTVVFVKRALIAVPVLLALVLSHAIVARAQDEKTTEDFQRMAAKLAGDREAGEIGQTADAGAAALEEKALESLDAIVLKALNADGALDLAALNKSLTSLVTHENPTGEDYQVVRLPGAALAYALVANFGLAGPSAVRIYAGPAGHLALAGQIDCNHPEKFFDEYVELVPVAVPEIVFVTVAGRTDDLQTGIFTAWYFDGQALHQVWASDLLEQSNYKIDGPNFQLTYCANPDENHLGQCIKMVRDTYSYQLSAWKLLETKDLGAAVATPQ
jgi:hypothetical protein